MDAAQTRVTPQRKGWLKIGKYTVSQNNDTPLACYNFDTHQLSFIIFGRHVAEAIK